MPGYRAFTGKQKKQKRNRQKSNRKLRRLKRGTHENKYAYKVPKRKNDYDPEDKSYRDLPVFGEAGEIFWAGYVILYHGRRYRLREKVTIPEGRTEATGHFKLF